MIRAPVTLNFPSGSSRGIARDYARGGHSIVKLKITCKTKFATPVLYAADFFLDMVFFLMYITNDNILIYF